MSKVAKRSLVFVLFVGTVLLVIGYIIAQRGLQPQVVGRILLPPGYTVDRDRHLTVGFFGANAVTGKYLSGGTGTNLPDHLLDQSVEFGGNQTTLRWDPAEGWSYMLDGIPASRLLVYARRNGELSVWKYVRVVPATAPVRCDLRIMNEAIGSIQVLVVNADGQGIREAGVALFPADESGKPFIDDVDVSSSLGLYKGADEEGRVDFRNIYAGKYLAEVRSRTKSWRTVVRPERSGVSRAVITVKD